MWIDLIVYAFILTLCVIAALIIYGVYHAVREVINMHKNPCPDCGSWKVVSVWDDETVDVDGVDCMFYKLESSECCECGWKGFTPNQSAGLDERVGITRKVLRRDK